MVYFYQKNVFVDQEEGTCNPFLFFLLFTFLFCIIPSVSKADGRPYKVKNIGSVASLTPINDSIYFWGDTANGEGLWTSDGTSTGTNEIYHMIGSRRFTLVNGNIFFTADENYDGNSELWLTDGTHDGTRQIKVINTYCQCDSISGLKSFKNLLFFSAFDPVYSWELWRSDGIAQGTAMVKNIHPEEQYEQGSGAAPDFEFQDHLYFAADDGTHGSELWVSDGTNVGTYIFDDINPGGQESHSAPSHFINFGDKFLFSAFTDSTGRELWISKGLVNGSNDGTLLLKDIFPGTKDGVANSSDPENLVLFEGKVYFIAADSYNPDNPSLKNYALWSTDGTPEGTSKVYGHPDWYGNYIPGQLTVVGDKLFFVAGDQVHQVEVWVSDGTASGTHLLKDIYPGRKDGFFDYPRGLTKVGASLYFAANDGRTGSELWKSDGTADGTVLVKDIVPGSDGSQPDEFVVTPSHLFFRVNSMELWAIDRNATSGIGQGSFWDLFLPAILSGKK